MITTLKQKPYNYGIRKGKPPLTYYNITNCVTEIPEKVKCRLENGTLILEAGSTVIKPNGFEEDGVTRKFDYITIDSDLTKTDAADFTDLCFLNSQANNIGHFRKSGMFYAGPTPPPPPYQYMYWYNTKDNICQVTSNSGVNWDYRVSFPFCEAEFTAASGVVSIKVFNNSGYIGNTIWYDKGFKGLMSNGRNDDRTLKNIPYTHEVVSTLTATDSGTIFISPNWTTDGSSIIHRALLYFEQDTPPDVTTNAVVLWRNPDANKNYVIWKNGNINDWMEIECIVLNDYAYNNGIIQGLTPLNPIELAQAKDLDGRWVKYTKWRTSNNSIIFNGISMAENNSFSVDLTNFLPNDDECYEVLFYAYGRSGTASGNTIMIWLETNRTDVAVICSAQTRTSTYVAANGCLYAVVDGTRQLKVSSLNQVGTATNIGLQIKGFRKVR